jgi:uncharacterized protein YjbJ (UPF0337 family)
MSNDKAAQAREGLFYSMAGKAKEVAGAVSGKDNLVEEGQLQQAESRNRKAALADEAIADAKEEEAAKQVNESSRAAAEQKDAARTQAQREESAVEGQLDNEHAVADRAAERQQAMGQEVAEQRGDELAESRLRDAESMTADATTTEQQAAAENRRLQREATAADQQAAKLRALTEN